MGNLLRTLGDREGARVNYLKWSALVPESTEPLLTLLNFAEASGDDASTRAALDGLRSGRRKNDPFALVAQALELLRGGRNGTDPPPADQIDQAELLVAELNQIAPALSWRSYIEGRIREYRGNLNEAAMWYRKANSTSKVGPALSRLIEIYMRTNNQEQLGMLEREYDDASTKSPGLAKEFAQVSLELARKFDDKERVGHFALRLVDGRALADQARLLHSVGRTSEAEYKLQQLVKARPQDPSAWFSLIKYQAIHAAPSEVAKTIDEARSIYEGERPELFLAQCYWAAEDRANATKAFEARQIQGVRRSRGPEGLCRILCRDRAGPQGRRAAPEGPEHRPGRDLGLEAAGPPTDLEIRHLELERGMESRGTRHLEW